MNTVHTTTTQEFNEPTPLKRRVRFNPKETQYIIPINNTEVRPPLADNYIIPYYPTNSPTSNIFTTPHLTWNESYAWVKVNYLVANGLSAQNYTTGVWNLKPEMSAPAMSSSMESAQRVPWDVHTKREKTELDGHCATVFPNIHQMLLHSDLLLDDILVTPAPGDDFITVGRVYDAVQTTLETQIYVSSPIYGMCSGALKRAVWEASKRRSRENEIRIVQYTDFLLDNHIMLGVSMKTDTASWGLHFGRIMISKYDIQN